jgi:SAM-dependent methyltransferase
VFAVEVAKNALAALSPGLIEWRHRQHELVQSCAVTAFDKHRGVIERRRPVSGRVLEVGPGGGFGLAELFVEHGCDVVCIDIERWADEAPAGVEYVWPCSIESANFPDNSFDLVVSTACFEHFADPERAVWNIARMLKPGGVTSHQIDLRDHRNFDRPLDFLRYSDRVWSLMTSHRPGQPNRWRASDILQAFDRHGLDVYSLDRSPTSNVSEAERARFAPRFRSKSLDDLGTLGVFLAATS